MTHPWMGADNEKSGELAIRIEGIDNLKRVTSLDAPVSNCMFMDTNIVKQDHASDVVSSSAARAIQHTYLKAEISSEDAVIRCAHAHIAAAMVSCGLLTTSQLASNFENTHDHLPHRWG